LVLKFMSSGFVKKRMTKTKDKVTLQVLISRKTYEMLVKLAPEIYGATRGASESSMDKSSSK